MAIAPRGIISYHPAASAFNSPLGGVSGYIAHVDETGKLLNTIAPVTSARRGVRVSDHDFQHIIDSLATSAKPRRLGQLYGDKAAIADSMYRPAFWPPVDRAVIGFDETIWLRRGDTDGKHTWFWLLSDKAVPEASVSLPYGFVLVRATRDLVWGWRPDSDGVPVVERYRLRR